jgi:type I restriction-modification system DNA methylase subunit
MRLTFAEAQRNVAEIANRESYTKDVIFELLAAYGRSASAITKLRSGALNLAEDSENDVLQRGVVYFKHVPSGNLRSVIDSLDKDPLVVRYNPRYLIATDYDQLVAKDIKKDTTLDIKLRDIDRNVDFFYGWTGDEVTSEKTEAVADRRAADKMKDLYAEIERVNRDKLADPKSTFRHDLNVFFSRLLFCFFAEDTKVFSKTESSIFTSSIKDYTQTDGSDLDEFLRTLFDSLDTEDKSAFTSPYSKFPYVNGTIFDTKKHNIAIPKFNAQARKLILDCGNQNWALINPDIFGSMFQSIVDEDHRANNGMHYTSVPNIMRTIEPLFIDELREQFDANYDNPKKLERLWDRISKIKVFDPACGSGNFLIIAYKELRKIEHGIIDRLFSDDYKRAMLSGRLESRIKLDNFYGIEIDDFAHEIAILSLYLAKHQMNIEFEEHFGKEIILIPLKDNAKIVQGNSMRIDWNDVCPNIQHSLDKQKPDQQYLIELEQEYEQEALISDEDLKQKYWDEIYLIGNPPYLGSSLQDADQKRDMTHVFSSFSNYKNLDLIAAWFKLGADYIKGTKAQLAFVSTNSICQGEQVALLWPYIFDKGVEIGFAYTSFKWTNGARNVAGVTVVVINLRSKNKANKYIYDNLIRAEVPSISAYLTAGSDSIFFNRRAKSISGLPDCVMGSKPTDGGFLIFDEDEREKIVTQYPESKKYIKQYTGSGDYINGKVRYCFWISDSDAEHAKTIPPIAEKINKVAEFRAGRTDTPSTVEYAKYPHRFRQRAHKDGQAIIIPSVSSERREYIPIGFLDGNTVASNAANVVYDAPIWLFGIISSRMHMAWVRVVAGKLKTDFRYSSAIVYANYPLPVLSESQKQTLSGYARNVLLVRENHSEKTLAEMYDPTKMPEDLREAHHELDLAVDRLYRPKPYSNDEERLADLFSLYEQMTKAEKEKTK